MFDGRLVHHLFGLHHHEVYLANLFRCRPPRQALLPGRTESPRIPRQSLRVTDTGRLSENSQNDAGGRMWKANLSENLWLLEAHYLLIFAGMRRSVT